MSKSLLPVLLLSVLLSSAVNAGVSRRPVTGLSKSGSSVLKGDVTFSAGSGVTLTQAGQDISIAATGSGSAPVVQTKTANYTVTTTDSVVLANTAGGPFTLTLPACSGLSSSFDPEIILVGASVVTVATSGGENIGLDSQTTATIAVPETALKFLCKAGGTRYYVH